MATLSFSAAVAQWADKVEGAVEAIFKEATQEVVEEMQTPVGQGGRMRVDTGFLRASLLASSTAMPAINAAASPAEGSTYAPDFAQLERTSAIRSTSATRHLTLATENMALMDSPPMASSGSQLRTGRSLWIGRPRS